MKKQPILRMELTEPAAIQFVSLPQLNIHVSESLISNTVYRCFLRERDGRAVSGTWLGDEEQPAVGMSWDDANRFCKWLNTRAQQTPVAGYLFRLPQETEWESYTRCRVVTAPPWGAVCPDFGTDEHFRRIAASAAAATRSARARQNAWGLWINQPRLQEWTGDIFDPEANYRILRGACWFGRIEGREQALYYRTPAPDRGLAGTGFRIVAVKP
jgi:formylglycine-generating enzyme required for sulfatase activity